ncbi:MAG: AAA family ATPase [Planctomycetota bacterium]
MSPAARAARGGNQSGGNQSGGNRRDAKPAATEDFTPPPIRSWDDLIGHQRTRQSLQNAIARNRISGSYLWVGPQGIGKSTTAVLLAQTLMCRTREPAEMDPCGVCPDCIQVHAGTHPDLARVRKPDGRASIPIDLLIGPPEARMQEGFCRDLRMRPLQGRCRVGILQDADSLQIEAANCLLKTLEEPPAGAVIIVIGSSEQRQLPTIRSRCRVVRMGPLAEADAANVLRTRMGVDASSETMIQAIRDCGGDLRAAARCLGSTGQALRQTWQQTLSAPVIDPLAVIRELNSQMNAAGKEPAKRRDALRDALAMIISLQREQVRSAAAAGVHDDAGLRRIDRSVRAVREIDRMANLSTVIECYAADLLLSRTGDRGQIG